MKDIKNYIIESRTPNKISVTGKKKLTKYINDLIKHVDDIWDYARIATDDADQVYNDCRDTVWNWVNDEGICSWDTEDEESNTFIEDEYTRLCDAIREKYNL